MKKSYKLSSLEPKFLHDLASNHLLSDQLLKQLAKQLLPCLTDAHAGGQHLIEGRVKSEDNYRSYYYQFFLFPCHLSVR